MALSKTTLVIQSCPLVLLSLLAAFLLSANALRLQRSTDDTSRLINNSRSTGFTSTLPSIFSPRMDFEQWKPLTGRGNPLRNDPTYDYEPPVLERVHYWADDTKTEKEHFPEKKSEVLMLGVSSRKPSVTSRQPPLLPRRHPQFTHRPPPAKYEDFTYKLSDTYPMTILVPPPPPPPGHQPSLFILDDELPLSNSHIKEFIAPVINTKDTTNKPEKLTSMYALQEANLIYQSSSTSNAWIIDANETLPQHINNAVSSDYAGWGPTTPLDVYETANETHNLVSNDQLEESKHPYTFYKPMLSEAPPPPPPEKHIQLSTFLPTALPPTITEEQSTISLPEVWPTERTPQETTTENQDYYDDTPTEKPTTLTFQSTPVTNVPTETPSLHEGLNIFSMLGPMMSMPIMNGPDRPEDNLYAHASDNMQVYKERRPEDILKLENMQTMQPPPPVMFAESTTASHKQPYHANANIISSGQQNKPFSHTHDPYLHMRYTTPVTKTTSADSFDNNKPTTESSAPMYLIIQGHSKVKTYSSKPSVEHKHNTNNEIIKPNETNEVKHLHPKEKLAIKLNTTSQVRKSKAQNLKALVDRGLGSIEIQEADVGIKYDVSDGSDVPLELYRKGIVDSDENDYRSTNRKTKRIKRQIDLEDLMPFDEESIEEFVYNFFEGKKNDTSITGLIAQAVTSDAAGAVDELEDDEDNSEVSKEDEDR